ncbi:MAG: Nif3-like dinuclear metal center hexameric protein [Parachlamydiaceae bacterium]|nr:Nif3-like dinuclear metal center hexameric protein [Parachlamydiaceae bacterium]
MITLQELSSYLKELLQIELFSDGCPNGLQVEGKSIIKRLATAVSASCATIEAAIEKKADVLIVHHGIFWNRDSFVVEGTKRKKLSLLLKNELSLLAYHLPLDAHRELGNNWKAAAELGWHSLEPFGLYGGKFIGVRGTFEPKSREAFSESLESYYSHSLQMALGGKKIVSSAALISGGAHRSLLEASAVGVDCFITGSFDEPTWHEAFEEGINFFALGHSNTEKVGPYHLGRHLQERFGIPCDFLDIPNPF